MNIIRRNIPNAVTCLNIVSGCIAIAFAFRPYSSFCGTEGWIWSVTAIAAAAVFDFLDGFCARMLQAYSDMGKELDSLCDLVSFGVAPAAIIFNMLAASGVCPTWTLWALLLIPVGGALRLAKFNIDTRQTTSFIGLPIPANAIFWIGYAALLADGLDILARPYVALPVIVVMAWLMVSPLRLFSLKFKSPSWSANRLRYIFLILSVVLIAFFGLPSLCGVILLYILLSAASAVRSRR